VLGQEFPSVFAAARGGDEVAFARLWRDAHPPLVRYLRVMGVASPEDVGSEVWLAVVRRLGSFGGDEARFRGWLFTIARRRAIDSRRRVARSPMQAVPEPQVYERAGRDYTAERALDRLATERALALIASLPPDQAEVIVLRVVAGLGAKEVAEILGKSPGAVRVAAHRGLRRLAALLVDQGVAGGVTR
jgi:RNA polymerase sigma-70 factor (ECF subfamily)